MHRMRRHLVLVACGALLAGACGGGSDDDRSVRKIAAQKEDIKVGAIFDLSGPTADVGVPYSEGIRDYVTWRNERGGVDGHQLALSWQDFAYKVPHGEQLYSQYVSQGAVAFRADGPAIKAGLEEIIGFETGGVAAPISFSTDNDAGLDAAPLHPVQGGSGSG